MSSPKIDVFIVEDDAFFSTGMIETLKEHDLLQVHSFSNGEECLKQLHINPAIVITDFNLPDLSGVEIMKKIKNYNQDIQVILISGQEELEVVVEAYNNGAKAYIIKNENALVELNNTVKNLLSVVKLQHELEELREQVIDRNKYSNILGNSPAILKILKMIQKVENKNILVLVTGESGTGKELVSKAIHYNSNRKKKPFVPVNMGAIPADLVESELFGHEKGAFTGANNKRIGKFEEAHQGTIFLDEIGEIDLDVQKKLLRVLQEQEVVRIGSNKTISLDVHVIAATNRNLMEEVKAGNFREDLYYRLQGFLIHLPPLRERGDDILILAKSFLKKCAEENQLGELQLSKDAAEALLNHSWPGNVRELKSTIERAALMADTNTITSTDILLPAIH